MLAFIGVLTFHLFASHLTWRDPTSSAPFLSALKLSLFTTGLWFAVAFLILPLINTFSSNPIQLFGSLVFSSPDPAFGSQLFRLTFGFPAIFNRDSSCVFAPLVPTFLYGLSLLPLLAKRTHTSLSFWLTTFGLFYTAFIFAAVNILNINTHPASWLALFALAGALSALSIKVIQLVFSRPTNIPTSSHIIQILIWIFSGAVASAIGLALGIAKTIIYNIPPSSEAFPQLVETLATGLLTASLMGALAAYYTRSATPYNPLPSTQEQPAKP